MCALALTAPTAAQQHSARAEAGGSSSSSFASYSSSKVTAAETIAETNPATPPPQFGEIRRTTFDWTGASKQSLFFLTIQHSARMTQRKTRRYLGGRFFDGWGNSIASVGDGWSDGDMFIVANIGHPMQGAMTAYIQVQNDPNGVGLEFENSRAYWHSRMKAMGWSFLYSTQFEIGPISEASIGHVGKKHGTNGLTDLIITPTGGFAFMVGEDWLDKKLIKRLEEGTDSIPKRRFYRVLFNPDRAVANVLRLKVPWHRDTRTLR